MLCEKKGKTKNYIFMNDKHIVFLQQRFACVKHLFLLYKLLYKNNNHLSYYDYELKYKKLFLDSKELFAIKSLRKAEVIENEQIEHTKTEKMILEHGNNFFNQSQPPFLG